MLDIILVNYNSTDYLLNCLGSIYDSLRESRVRVFVQDNASEDEVDRVASLFPQVVLSRNNSNMGFAKAVNVALKQSQAPYVALLNPDTIVTPGFFDLTLRYMEENSDVGVIGPKILHADGTIQGSARSFPTPLTGLFGRNAIFTRLFPNNIISQKNVLTNRSDGITPMDVDWVSGASMVVRREAIDQVGLLDERFFMYWEDADWCKRLRGSGWRVVYFPKASIVHSVGVSSEQLWPRTVIEFHKSAYRLFEKHARFPFAYTKPLVLFALGLRLVVVLFSQWIQRAISSSKMV